MEFLRTLRRRWMLLLFCAALGAALGYASTLLKEEETGPVVDYWAANEILVINAESTTGINLQTTGVFATKGDVPKAVAAARGVPVEELVATVRTVADFSENTLTISAVATSLDDAREISEQVSQALLDSLEADALESYNERLFDAQELVDQRAADLADFNDQINAIPESRQDELDQLEVQRSAALVRLGEAQGALAEIQRVGPPPPALVELDAVPPFRISPREYGGRIARGRQGDNNYTAGEVELADTSSPTVSERLENPAARGFLGAIAGLVLGAMFIGIHQRLDPRLRTRDQIEAAFGLPVLTTVPAFGRKDRKDMVLHARDSPRSAVAESYRYLRSVLLFARSNAGTTQAVAPAHHEGVAADPDDPRAEREVRVVMVTSAGEGEGKTTTAVNLAVLMAESGYDTMLINCDFRLPSAHKLFGVEYAPGTVSKTGVVNLRFVSDVKRGDDDTPGQVSERQRKLIRRARDLVDVVVLDTAPLLATNDAIDILPETDLAILVAREAKTTSQAAGEARELLMERIGVPVAGVVVTAGGSGLGSGYYEKYRYGSYFSTEAPTLFAVAKRLIFGARKEPEGHLMPDEHFDPPSDPDYAPTHTDDTVEVVPALHAEADPVEGLDAMPGAGPVVDAEVESPMVLDADPVARARAVDAELESPMVLDADPVVRARAVDAELESPMVLEFEDELDAASMVNVAAEAEMPTPDIFSMDDFLATPAPESAVEPAEPEAQPPSGPAAEPEAQPPSGPAAEPEARPTVHRQDLPADGSAPLYALPKVVRPYTPAKGKSKESNQPPTFQPAAPPVPADDVQPAPVADSAAATTSHGASADDIVASEAGATPAEELDIDLRFQDWLARRKRDAEIEVD